MLLHRLIENYTYCTAFNILFSMLLSHNFNFTKSAVYEKPPFEFGFLVELFFFKSTITFKSTVTQINHQNIFIKTFTEPLDSAKYSL
jgi:hypothetical protein